jgi:predicted dehydrogenase
MAAAHGLHVLCEKPLAMTDADAEQMIRTMERAERMLFTGFCYRFSPVSLQIKELVAQGAIGQVRSLRLLYVWNLHGKYETINGHLVESPRRVGRMLEGGPMVDCGVHQIDLARFWLGSEVVRQQAAGAWVDEGYEAPDHMWLHMDHDSGAHTMVEMSFSYTHTAQDPISHFSYHLIGTDGLIRYDREGWRFEVRNGRETRFLPGADEKNFQGMYQAFTHALYTGETGYLSSGEDGLIATRIARTATEAVIAARPTVRPFDKGESGTID